MKYSLLVMNGKFKGQRFTLFPGMVIGRGEKAHLYLPDFKASRQHASLENTDDGFNLVDLKSHNGTFVNGNRVDSLSLKVGDVISIGTTNLEFMCEESTEQRARAAFEEHAPGLTPTIVKRIDLSAAPSLDEMLGEGYLEFLGLPSADDVLTVGPDKLKRIVNMTRNFAIVNEISRALGDAVSVDELLCRAMDYILRVITANRGHVVLIDPKTGDLIPGVARRPGGVSEDAPLNVSHTIIDWVIQERTAVVSSDAASDQRFEDKKSIVLYNIRSVLCVPMLHGETTVGVIQLDSEGGSDGFSHDDLELLAVIAPVLAVAVENTRLIEAQEKTIGEVRAANDKLIAAQDALVEKEKMAIVGRFTSGLAHEIRNLMGPLLLADLLQSEYPDDERIQEYANIMLDAYRRVRSLVEEIRMLARGEKAELELEYHSITDTIESVVRFVRCDQEVKPYKIVTDLGEVAPFAYDDYRIKQVLINLIRNAVQAMDNSGDITIHSFSDQEFAHVAVTDVGEGISPEALAQIWEPFFSTKGESGTGLGLDICRRIVERHGGHIECKSELGKGTTMQLSLPLTRS